MEITYENWLFASGGIVGALITLAASYGLNWLSIVAAKISCREEMQTIISDLKPLSAQLRALNHSDELKELTGTMKALSAQLEKRQMPNRHKKSKQATSKTHINGAASSQKQ